jgi:hypothetical protein
MAKIGRNQLCPCGSGKKYKYCCLSQEQHQKTWLQLKDERNQHVDFGTPEDVFEKLRVPITAQTCSQSRSG